MPAAGANGLAGLIKLPLKTANYTELVHSEKNHTENVKNCQHAGIEFIERFFKSKL